MKTILYATDYSQNSIAALKSAHLLTQKFNMKLIVTFSTFRFLWQAPYP
ncbi:hypothetical protein SAMN05421636_10564 [Pricia antarctica]|uniref:Universal stress protein family protein n=1 Tax=Pricia antarctica TaxID=641691 RepID=A0A1G7CWY9_9FLAO|nr:hypothetical protein SAMN05421636_10564 [Pricia antarctica]